MNNSLKKDAERWGRLVGWVLAMAALAFVPQAWADVIAALPESWAPEDQLLYELLPVWLMPLYAFVCYCLVFCTILKTVAVYDGALEEKLGEYPMSVGIRDELSVISRHRPFYINLFLIETLYLAAFIVGIFKIDKIMPKAAGDIWIYIATAALFMLTAFLLFLVSYLSAFNAWKRDRIRQRESGGARRGFVWRLSISLFPTLLATALLAGMVPYFISLRFIFSAVFLRIILAVAFFFAALYIFRIVRAILTRRSFCRGLRDVCREFGFELSEIKKPLISAVRMTGDESFRVKARGRTYVCKLIGVHIKRNPLTVYEDGVCLITRSVRLRGYTFFNITNSYDLGFDTSEDEAKIFIFNPTPAMLLARRGSYEAPIDVGESVGRYRVHTGTSFINALRRDTLDR